MAHAGGRPPGSLNKRSSLLAEKLDELNCHPHVILAHIALNDVECSVCRGAKRSKFKLPDGSHSESCSKRKLSRLTGEGVECYTSRVNDAPCTCEGISDRICQSCLGTGMEAVSVKDRKDAASDLMQYRFTKLKAVEHTGTDGEELRTRLVIEYVDAPKKTNEV